MTLPVYPGWSGQWECRNCHTIYGADEANSLDGVCHCAPLRAVEPYRADVDRVLDVPRARSLAVGETVAGYVRVVAPTKTFGCAAIDGGVITDDAWSPVTAAALAALQAAAAECGVNLETQ
jgi:hypothetical protein